jgi:hypothetical protein
MIARIVPQTPSCHDDYTANSFETAEDNLAEFIDEYFIAHKIPFLPTKKNIISLGLASTTSSPDTYMATNAMLSAGGGRNYPSKAGVWKIYFSNKDISQTHILIKEPQRLGENRAFNTYNDLLGDIFADYDARAYIMTSQPEDLRYRYNGTYFTINISIYGTTSDATSLPKTVADVVLTNYTSWVHKNKECNKK